MDFKSVLPRPRKALTKEQKAAFVLLMFLGLGGTLLGFMSFGANIRRPFEIQLARYAGEAFLTPSQQELQEQEAMKSRDTDGDGLNDYDETNVFKTSAYLADTDSDGFDDKTEVFSGNDPTCPQGKDCGRVVASADEAADASPDATAIFGPLGVPFSEATAAGLTLETEEDMIAFLEDLSVEQIRQALLDYGVDQATLDEIDDETLRDFYREAVQQAQDTGQLNAEAEAEGTSSTQTP